MHLGGLQLLAKICTMAVGSCWANPPFDRSCSSSCGVTRHPLHQLKNWWRSQFSCRLPGHATGCTGLHGTISSSRAALTWPGLAVADLVVLVLLYGEKYKEKDETNVRMSARFTASTIPVGLNAAWNGNQQAGHAFHLICWQQMVINIKLSSRHFHKALLKWKLLSSTVNLSTFLFIKMIVN